MASQQPIVTGADDRVIKFRPRAIVAPSHLEPASSDEKPSVGSTQPGPNGSLNSATPTKSKVSDDRHRMMMNVAALVFTLLLTGLGVWLATTITELRKTQDCLLVGRRDCTKMPPLRPYQPRPANSI